MRLQVVWSVSILLLAACGDDSGPVPVTDDPAPGAPVASVPMSVRETFGVGENVFVRSLAVEEGTGTLWVGTSLGAHEIDLGTRTVRNTFTRDHGLANEYIFGIGIDAAGHKWFGTNAGGMSRYKDGEWQVYMPMHGLADYWIYAFANDPDGGLWIGTWAGVSYLDPARERFTNYVKELVNEWVYGIAVDRRGRIWFGTEGGISRYDGQNWRSWTHRDGVGADNLHQLPFSRNTGLGTRTRHDLGILADGQATYNPNYVFAIIVDRDDAVWAGTWGGGVSRYDGKTWRNFTENDGLAGNIVYSIAEDPSGELWFGTNRGLSRYDGTRWQNYNVHNGLPNNHVYAIAADASGSVWVGVRGAVVRLGPTE